MTTSSSQASGHPLHGQRLGRTARARDPNLSAHAGATPQPTPAPLTTGNNRVTIRVPAQATKLNLGQGDATETATRNKRLGVGTESGIVGQTDAHIHWETFGTLAAEAKTLVRLGIPPTSVPPGGYAAGASTGIGCMFPEAYSTWDGYSMVTQGAAYQEAQHNHLVVSATGEVRVVGKTLISIASSGDVIIGADGTVSPQTLVQNQGSPSDPGAFGEPDQYFRIQKLTAVVDKSVALVESATGIVAAAMVAMDRGAPLPGMTGWVPLTVMEAIKNVALGLAKLGTQIYSTLSTVRTPSGASGGVGVYAERDVTLGATESVSIHAGMSAGTIAGISASMCAPFVSSTGLVSSSMSGIFASVAALYSATLQSSFGTTTVRSPAGVKVYSTFSSVAVTGSADVQLNSVLGGAHVHGLANAYIGSGDALGWGLRATPVRLVLGQMAAPGIFTEPGFLPMFGVSITDAMLTVQHTASYVKVSPIGVNVFADVEMSTIAPVVSTVADAEISMEAPLITIAGAKVMLG
jgi:hypothetical protein